MTKIISPPLCNKCPSCSSDNVYSYYDMAKENIFEALLMIFFIKSKIRHYRCVDCKCVWVD